MSGLLALRRKLLTNLSGYETSVVEGFDEWADQLFANALAQYPVAIRSDADALNIVYPPDDQRYTRLRIQRKGTKTDVGWIVVASKQMRDNHYFGNLQVGTLVDGFGRTEDVAALIAAGLNRFVSLSAGGGLAVTRESIYEARARQSGSWSARVYAPCERKAAAIRVAD